MDNEKLEKKLDTIFDKEYFDEDGLEMRYRYINQESVPISVLMENLKDPPLLIPSPEDHELHFPSHEPLMSLFNQISNNDTNLTFFIDYMLRKISSPRKDSDLILAFDTLFRLDYIKDTFNALYTWCQAFLSILEVKNRSDIEYFFVCYISLIKWLEDIIRHEYNKISDENLDLIEKNINRLLRVLPKLTFQQSFAGLLLS